MILKTSDMKGALILAVLLVNSAGAQPTESFTATGSMTVPRFSHTATLLNDGKVLIAGGMTQTFSPTATAEVYDPLTGTFTATGSMTGPRYDHTATLLPDGRVLIAGGGDASGHPSLTAELYDPSSATFTSTGSLAAGHWNAALLNNGMVLMGPLIESGGLSEIYDPTTGTFAVTGGSADRTFSHIGTIMTSLADGRVIIPADSPPEIYDPAAGSFSFAGPMLYPQAQVGLSATLLPNGLVLFAGGEIDNEYNIGADPAYPDDVYPYGELYDPVAGSFLPTGNLIESRFSHTATLLPDGSALMTGGLDRVTVQSAEIYHPSIGTFSSAGIMVVSRRIHDATLLNDGRVLITGGLHSLEPPLFGYAVLASAELYTPAQPIPAPALFSISGDGRGERHMACSQRRARFSDESSSFRGNVFHVYQ